MAVNDVIDMEPVQRMSRDLAKAGATLTPSEARFLVDSYYMMQEERKRSANQVRALETSGEPNAILGWFAAQSGTLEQQVARALDSYSANHPVGAWMREVDGIGPVISAGLLAHIDIHQAPTVGHIWRFAGLDPTSKWLGKEKGAALAKQYMKEAEGNVVQAIQTAVVSLGWKGIAHMATHDKEGEPITPTLSTLSGALARRPWNAQLKVLCWKIGESFVKVSGNPEAFYGRIYAERKAYEAKINQERGYAEVAKKVLAEKNIGRDTDAYKAYSIGMLPPAHIHARAKRYAVKLFLAHVHEVWRKHEGLEVPLPYPIAFLGHAHKIEPPRGAVA